MLLREFLGHSPRGETERSAAWIRSQQRADGTWANFHGGPGELSTTIEAYWALRLAGDPPEARAHARGGRVHPRAGRRSSGRACSRTCGWRCSACGRGIAVPALPPEIVLLPSWVPLNVYDFACWARQTIVALSIVKAHRPCARCRSTSSELRDGSPPDGAPAARARWRRAAGVPVGRLARARLDRADARATSAGRSAPLRRLALGRAERWIVRRQEADGSWGGIQPPWVYSLIALQPRAATRSIIP